MHWIRIFILIMTAGIGSSLLAATGGPDGYGYTWIDSNEAYGPAFRFIEPTTAAVTVIGNTSTVAATVSLVHPWSGIYGEKVTQLRISRNGFITDLLSDPGGDETNDAPLPFPPSQGGGNRLYVLHDNLRLDSTNGRISYEYFPESPHPLHDSGVHVITWENIHHATGDTNRFSMQALLFDNFDILFQYGAGNPELGSNSTTGIQNSDATIGLQVAANTPNSIPDEYAVRILPPIVVVNTALDQLDTPAGPQISLREAIRDAAPGSRIEFSSAFTMVLSTNFASRIPLDGRNLALDGSTFHYTSGVVISGDHALRHFRLFNNAHLYLGHIRLMHGYGPATDLSGSTLVEQGSSLIAFQTEWNVNRTELDGGAIALRNSDTVVRLQRCGFRLNRAEGQGGAVLVRGGARLDIDATRFIANLADGGGGGLFAQNANLHVRSTEFSLNETVANGGGAQFGPGVAGLIFGTTFDDNRALNGGGVSIDNTISVINPPSDLTFVRCTFSENLALIAGGAVYEDSENFFGASAHPDFFYCTIVRNGAGVRGGGVATVDGQPRFSGVCLALNTVGINDNNFDTTGTGTAVSLGENLESGTDAGFTGVLDIQNTDPLLSDLGYFGGPVRTCMPLAGSPLIDSVGFFFHWPGADARGVGANPFDGNGDGIPAGDIGAVEVGPSVWVNTATIGALQAAIDAAPLGGVIRFSNVHHIADADITFPAQTMVFIQKEGSPLILEDARLVLTNGIHQHVALHNIDITLGASGTLGATAHSSLGIAQSRIRKYAKSGLAQSAISSSGGRVSLNQVDMLDGDMTHAIYQSSRAQTWIRDSMIRDNRVTTAAINALGTDLVLQRSSILQNRFDDELVRLFTGYYFFENNTVADNQSLSAVGSTLYNQRSEKGSALVLRNNTIVRNLGARGIFGVGSATAYADIANNIIAQHTFLNMQSVTSNGGNLSDTAIPGAQPSDLPLADPTLYPLSLGLNGTLHHAPRPGSPAIDAGLPVFVGLRDGRRGLRYRNGTGVGGPQQDIGAVESGRILTVTTALDEDDGGLGLGAGDSLRECIAAATNFGRAVNIDLGSIGAIVLTDRLDISNAQVDIDARLAQTQISRFAGGFINLLSATNRSLVSIDGAHYAGRSLVTRTESVMTLSRGSITDVQTGTYAVYATSSGRLRLSRMRVQDNIRSILLSTSAGGHIDVDRSVLMNNRVQSLIGPFDGQVSVRYSLINRNIASNELANIFSSQINMVRSTSFRNSGGNTVTGHTGTRFRSTDSIHANNPVSLDALLARSISYGGNLSDQSPNYFDASKGDLTFRNPYMAPAIDAELDDAVTLRPLAISPAFNTRTGAHPPPPHIITVTTLADENDTPAGAQISLREAIRDITDGGVIVFDPLLNNRTIELILNSGEINILNKNITIDATTLPNGIDIIGRLVSTSPGRTLGLHGIHFRDFDPGFVVGGAVGIQNGNLVGSHLAFSGLNSDQAGGAIYLQNGQLVLENVTFSSNAAPSGAAIGLLNATGTVEFATFGEQQGTAAGVIEGANATVRLHGSVFFKNDRAAFAGVTFVSDGYNAFPGNPAGAGPTDEVNRGGLNSAYEAFADYGGWVPTYRPNAAATNVMNTLPPVVAGMVPPPMSDSRGFSRVAGTSADWGAHEFGGGTFDSDGDGLYNWWELLYGFDPNTFTDPDQDLDGDGWTLIQEQGWGTNPFNTDSSPGAVLTITGPDPYMVEAHVNSIAGITYLLRGTTHVTSLGGFTHEIAVGNGFPMVLTAPLPVFDQTNYFYRLERAMPAGVW